MALRDHKVVLFLVLQNLYNVFPNSCANYISINNVQRFADTFLSFDILRTAFQQCEVLSHSGVWICISMMISDIEHSFMYLWPLYVFFGKT